MFQENVPNLAVCLDDLTETPCGDLVLLKHGRGCHRPTTSQLLEYVRKRTIDSASSGSFSISVKTMTRGFPGQQAGQSAEKNCEQEQSHCLALDLAVDGVLQRIIRFEKSARNSSRHRLTLFAPGMNALGDGGVGIVRPPVGMSRGRAGRLFGESQSTANWSRLPTRINMECSPGSSTKWKVNRHDENDPWRHYWQSRFPPRCPGRRGSPRSVEAVC